MAICRRGCSRAATVEAIRYRRDGYSGPASIANGHIIRHDVTRWLTLSLKKVARESAFRLHIHRTTRINKAM
jgi:hypothetical protein